MNKKYLLVTEMNHETDTRSTPVLLQVVKETRSMYYTPEMYALGLRDLEPLYMRKGLVRWSRETGRRVGDSDVVALFKVHKTVTNPTSITNAMVIQA